MSEPFGAVDASVCLDTDDQIAASLTAVLLTGDQQLLAETIRAVLWSKVVTHLERQLHVAKRDLKDMLTGQVPFSLNVLLPLLKEYDVMLVAEPRQAKGTAMSTERVLKRV